MFLETQFKTHTMVESSRSGKQTEVNGYVNGFLGVALVDLSLRMDQPRGDPKFCHHKNPAFN